MKLPTEHAPDEAEVGANDDDDVYEIEKILGGYSYPDPQAWTTTVLKFNKSTC